MCLTIPLMVETKVARVQEASVVVYDYYESSKSLRGSTQPTRGRVTDL